MYEKLIHLFIKHADQTYDTAIREQYGIVFAVISIILNTLMSAAKVIGGVLSHSQAMISDAINNLSDATSHLVVLFGFKMAAKHPDAHHPYGHGRYEYVAGVVVSIIMMSMGLMAARDGLVKIIHPEPVIFRVSSLLILVTAIVIKGAMYWLNIKTAKKIDSEAFYAAAKDALNDMLVSATTLLALIFGFVPLPLDGIISVAVSGVIIYSGYQSLRATLTPLIGRRPDPTLIQDIKASILAEKRVLGLHDVMLHDYGAVKSYLSAHVEVDAKENLVAIHDVIDALERKLEAQYHLDAVLHIDPVDRDDPMTNALYQQVKEMIDAINQRYAIHDFRIIKGREKIKVLFDVLIPYDDQSNEKELAKSIREKLRDFDERYEGIITIDHPLV